MKKILLGLGCLSLNITAFAQEDVSIGAMYANQTFYDLSTGDKTSSLHSEWHIAFSVSGAQDAGVFINEGASLGGGRVELYMAPTNNFNDLVDPNNLTTEYTNQELNWTEGAFNEAKDASNPFDYGWGAYDMSSHQVVGNKVYVVKLQNGNYQKIMIDSLVNGIYHFTYADLDGANQQHGMVNKSNHSGQVLAYYSLTSNTTVSGLEPTDWDLLFTRYETMVDDGNGGLAPYTVTGVLSGMGVEVAQADMIDPNTVDVADYTNDFISDDLNVIGSDWKSYDFTVGWVLVSDRAYFVKTADETIWKVVLIDFQGSSTGVSTLLKEDLGTLSSVENVEQINGFSTYPNPASDQLTVAFDANNYDANASIQLYSVDGRVAIDRNISVNAGFNVVELNGLDQFAQGSYFLVLNIGNEKITQSIILR